MMGLLDGKRILTINLSILTILDCDEQTDGQMGKYATTSTIQ